MSSIPLFIFISPHLHSNTYFLSYSQSQHHSLSKCQTRQEKLPIVVFSVPSSSQTPWSRRPHWRNLPVFDPVPSFYQEGCLTHYQFRVHPLDQTWLDALMLAYILAHRSCSYSSSGSPHLVMYGALWSESLCHSPDLECSNLNTSCTLSR